MKAENHVGGKQEPRLLAGSMVLDPTPARLFSESTIEFLAALSEQIRRLPRSEAGEEMRALGFWLRRSNLMEFKKKYGRPDSLGLGISFHIAPSNVPLLFLYTCAIGLLAGNSCRVRISERKTEECDRLCKLIAELLEEERFGEMKNRISMVVYDRANTELTKEFSRECDVRVIWGGDRTVEEIRKIPIRASASEIAFPDRTSMTVLGAEAVMALEKEELEGLAARFYNDTYGMDQNACSCPKAVFWEEEKAETGRLASERFWNAVAKASERYALSEIKVSQKYGALWECAGLDAGIQCIRTWKNRLYVLETSDISEKMTEKRMQFGSFLEYHMKDRGEWTGAITEKVQTLTFFGVRKADLLDQVCSRRLRGILRIVPVGQALLMDLVWDGKDLIGSLSRTIGRKEVPTWSFIRSIRNTEII